MDVNSSGEHQGNVLGENVWGGFRALKESTESALTRFASEKHTVQGIQEISRRHLAIKRCHSTLIRQLTGQAINIVRNSGGYEELKYVIREITTLLIKTRNDRDSAVDMFLTNSTQHPMMNCMEELEEEVTPLPAQLSPSPVTAISIVEEDTAVLYATATLMPVLLDVNIVETVTPQHATAQVEVSVKEDLPGTSSKAAAMQVKTSIKDPPEENLNVKCWVIQCLNTNFLVLQLLRQEQMDLGIVTALQSPFDRGKTPQEL